MLLEKMNDLDYILDAGCKKWEAILQQLITLGAIINAYGFISSQVYREIKTITIDFTILGKDYHVDLLVKRKVVRQHMGGKDIYVLASEQKYIDTFNAIKKLLDEHEAFNSNTPKVVQRPNLVNPNEPIENSIMVQYADISGVSADGVQLRVRQDIYDQMKAAMEKEKKPEDATKLAHDVKIKGEGDNQMIELYDADGKVFDTTKVHPDTHPFTVDDARMMDAMYYMTLRGSIGPEGNVKTLPTSDVGHGDAYIVYGPSVRISPEQSYHNRLEFAYSGDQIMAVSVSNGIKWVIIPAGTDTKWTAMPVNPEVMCRPAKPEEDPKIETDIKQPVGGLQDIILRGSIGPNGDIKSLPTSNVKYGDSYVVAGGRVKLTPDQTSSHKIEIADVGDTIVAVSESEWIIIPLFNKEEPKEEIFMESAGHGFILEDPKVDCFETNPIPFPEGQNSMTSVVRQFVKDHVDDELRDQICVIDTMEKLTEFFGRSLTMEEMDTILESYRQLNAAR